jgi:hypothetical protein
MPGISAYEFFKTGLPPGIERYFDSINGDLLCPGCKTPMLIHSNEWGTHSNPDEIKHYCKATGFYLRLQQYKDNRRTVFRIPAACSASEDVWRVRESARKKNKGALMFCRECYT